MGLQQALEMTGQGAESAFYLQMRCFTWRLSDKIPLLDGRKISELGKSASQAAVKACHKRRKPRRETLQLEIYTDAN